MPVVYDKFTPGGIPYALREGYPTFKCRPDSITAVEKYLLDWTNLTALAVEYFRYGAATPYALPLPIQMPGFPALFCDEITLEPFIPDLPGDHNRTLPSGQSWRNYCIAVINYKTLEAKETEGNASFSRTTNIGGEFIEMPRQGSKWEDGTPSNTTGDPRIGKLSPSFDHTLSIDRLLQVPWNTMRALIGCVNLNTILGAPPETILFAGADIKSKTNLNGTSYSLDMKISEKPTNWNKFYRPYYGYQYISWEGRLPYELKDLSPLFV